VNHAANLGILLALTISKLISEITPREIDGLNRFKGCLKADENQILSTAKGILIASLTS